MIRLLSKDINEAVYSWIPAHRRFSIAVQLFQKLVTPFRIMMEEYVSWRDAAVTRAQVTGETASLEWYLNELFDPTNRDIYIETAGVSGNAAGLEGTAEPHWVDGIEASEAAVYEVVALPGEAFLYGTASFVVYVPVAIAAQEDAIARVVRVYKMAGRSFKIITF